MCSSDLIEITHQGEKARLNLLFKKNNDDGYEYLFSLREEEPDQWLDISEEGLAGSSNILTWRESERPSQLLKKIYKLKIWLKMLFSKVLCLMYQKSIRNHWKNVMGC